MPSEVQKVVYAVKQSTDSVNLDTVESGRYDEPSITFNKIPRARFTLSDPSGVLLQSVLTNGKEVEIRRGVNGTTGERRFLGIIETPEGVEDENGGHPTVTCVHKGYKMLQQHMCDTYDYDEDGDAVTTRDGVTVNPWRYFVLRKPGGVLDSRGDPLPLDGVKFNDVVKCLIGTKFVHQIDFQDNTYLKASQVYATTNKAQVHRDGPSSDLRPYLQRVRTSDTGFAAEATIDTIPLMSGSVNIERMGDITAVTVTLVGVLAASQNPEVAVTINARHATPTYSSYKTASGANILHDDAVTDSAFDKWTYTFAFGDLPATADKDALGLRIKLTGSSGDATTTKVMYAKVDATTASDTGLSEGTIDTYNNPVSLRSDIDPSDWVDSDFGEMNRLEAGEALRKLTESISTNPSPHWDLWIDSSLAVHFKERRGAAISGHDYSFANGNLRKVNHQFDGASLAYQTIAYGAGSGTAQTRIVSKEEFSTGGLYDVNRDPTGGTALYGQLPRVVRFVDESEKSPIALYRKARAFHKLHRDPIEHIRVTVESEFIRFFDVGDSITIKNLRTRTNGAKRVIDMSRSWSGGDFEDLDIVLGNPLDDLSRSVGNQRVNHETLVIRPQPNAINAGVSAAATYATKDRYGVFAFGIHEGQAVDRVFLKLTTVPWQITARGSAATTSASGGGSTVTSASGGSSTPTTSNVSSSDTNQTAISVGLVDGTSAPVATAKHRVWIGHTNGTRVLIWADVVTNPAGDPGDVAVTTTVALDPDGALPGHEHTVTIAAHTHDVTIGTHVHMIPATTPEFGIWQFDGDAGAGTGNPIYGSGIQLAVDPTLNAQGLPSTFSTEKHPTVFGSGSTPHTIEIDVTGYLDVDANGIIKTGEHRIYFLVNGSQTSNTNGLAAIMVTPVLRVRSGQT